MCAECSNIYVYFSLYVFLSLLLVFLSLLGFLLAERRKVIFLSVLKIVTTRNILYIFVSNSQYSALTAKTIPLQCKFLPLIFSQL